MCLEEEEVEKRLEIYITDDYKKLNLKYLLNFS